MHASVQNILMTDTLISLSYYNIGLMNSDISRTSTCDIVKYRLSATFKRDYFSDKWTWISRLKSNLQIGLKGIHRTKPKFRSAAWYVCRNRNSAGQQAGKSVSPLRFVRACTCRLCVYIRSQSRLLSRSKLKTMFSVSTKTCSIGIFP